MAGKQLIISSLFSVLVRGGGAIAGFGATFFVSKALGSEQAGVFFLVFAIVSILAALCRFGFDNVVVRFVASSIAVCNEKGVRDALIVSLSISAFLSLCTAVVIYFSAPLLSHFFLGSDHQTVVFKYMAFAVPCISIFTVFAQFLQGSHKPILSIVVLNIAHNMLFIVFILFFNFSSVEQISSTFFIACFVSMILGAYFVSRQINKIGHSGIGVDVTVLIKTALPLLVVVLMNQAVQWSSQLISGLMLGANEVALIATAQRTSMLVTIVSLGVNVVIAPKFSELYAKSNTLGLRILAQKSVILTSFVALPILLIMLFFSSQLMSLFGHEFAVGGPLLCVLALGQLINVLTGSVGFLLVMSGHEKDMRNVVLLSGFLAIILSYVFIKLFGVFGGCVATAVSIASQNIFAVYFVKKRLGFNTFAIWQLLYKD